MAGRQDVGMHNAALQSGSLLEEGLRSLEEDYRGEPETRDSILRDLSLGIEVLLKLTLRLFGESEKSIGRRHDIPALLDKLLPLVPSESMLIGRREFLEIDPRFRELLEILGKYGGAGKYTELDDALGRDATGASDRPASEMWEEMKLDLLDDEWFNLMKSDPGRFCQQYYPHLYRVVGTSLAYGVHSLWWLWTHGPQAEQGRRWHGSLTGGASRRVSALAMQRWEMN
jgi:hypothetical protein